LLHIIIEVEAFRWAAPRLAVLMYAQYTPRRSARSPHQNASNDFSLCGLCVEVYSFLQRDSLILVLYIKHVKACEKVNVMWPRHLAVNCSGASPSAVIPAEAGIHSAVRRTLASERCCSGQHAFSLHRLPMHDGSRAFARDDDFGATGDLKC
jgi:hypothetical protein